MMMSNYGAKFKHMRTPIHVYLHTWKQTNDWVWKDIPDTISFSTVSKVCTLQYTEILPQISVSRYIRIIHLSPLHAYNMLQVYLKKTAFNLMSDKINTLWSREPLSPRYLLSARHLYI